MNVRDNLETGDNDRSPENAGEIEHPLATAPRPESRRASAAGQRPTAPRAGAPSRDARRPGAAAERHHKPQITPVAALPRGRALPSVGAGRQTVRACAAGALATASVLLLLGLPLPAAADVLGIPLERQPFIKVCPDGSIVGSLGPNRFGETRDTFGAFAYDGRTRRTEFLQRNDDFNERLANNRCLRKPAPREPQG